MLSETWIDESFMGEVGVKVVCKNCQKESKTKEAFLELQVDLMEGHSLSSCIHNMLKHEELSNENKFDCDHCKQKSDASKV